MAGSQLLLSSCSARYLGNAIPTETTEYPEIIHKPLETIYLPYSSCTVKRHDLLALTTTPVTIRVFSSGIAVNESKAEGSAADWHPIQNLYCSAGVKPDKERKSVKFRRLSDKTKSNAQPLFAMVVRQPGSEGRRVLICHAYLLANITDAQKLVNSTKQAYQNKAGWNHPNNDKEFLNAKLSYTLQRLDENHESDLEELKVLSDKRDRQLGQQPSIKVTEAQPATRSTERAKSTVVRKAPQSQSMVVRRAPRAQSVIVQSAPPTPRLVVTPPAKPTAVDTGRVVIQHDLRVPTIRARGFYQGFNTETMNGEFGPVKAASDVGFTPSAGPSYEPLTSSHYLSPNPNNSSHGFSSTHRRHWSAATPRGHRILASSEPQELPNGFNGHGQTFVSHAEMNGDISPVTTGKKGKHSKHHRPSKKTLEKYLHQNGDDGSAQFNGQHEKERRTSQHSTESESGYSITRLDNQPTTSGINGFFSAHEHADQEF